MKKLTIPVLLLLSLALFSSCKKGGELGDPTPVDDTYLTCKIDGEDFINPIPVLTGVSIFVVEEIESRTMSIVSDDENKSGYRITLTRVKVLDKATGNEEVTYAMSCSKEDRIWLETILEGKDTSAEFTITSEDDTFVEGTFSFVGISSGDGSTKNITKGKFRAKIII